MPFVEYVPFKEPCRSTEHNPPNMMVLPAGRHTWQCPSCEEKTVFDVGAVYCKLDTDGRVTQSQIKNEIDNSYYDWFTQ